MLLPSDSFSFEQEDCVSINPNFKIREFCNILQNLPHWNVLEL